MKLSEAEWHIMNALWKKNPATAREVTERLPKETNWAYTTIKTMLSRLVDKEVVTEQKKGNTSVYEPLISKTKARSKAVVSLVNQAFDGTVGPLMHFLIDEKKLTKKQRKELLELLKNEEESGDKK